MLFYGEWILAENYVAYLTHHGRVFMSRNSTWKCGR